MTYTQTKRIPKGILIAFVILLTVVVGACTLEYMLVMFPNTYHEVTRRHDEVEPIEKRFPLLAGHVVQTLYDITSAESEYPSRPSLPDLGDYDICGIIMTDDEMAENLRNDYQWETANMLVLNGKLDKEIDPMKEWEHSDQLRDELIGGPSRGDIVFDGENTLVFKKTYY